MKNTKLPFNDNKGELVPYLDKWINKINNRDFDCFFVVCGNERLGKSTFAAQIGNYMADGNLDVDNVCMSIDQFLDALKNSKKGDIIIFDEAGTNLYSREAMSTMNRMLTKAFMVSGLKNVCIIFCIPSFFSLDTYIRMHRINLLFYIPERGKFKVYSKKRIREINRKGYRDKKMGVVKANLVGWFTKQYPESIERVYRLKEIKYKLSYLKNVKQNIEGNYSANKFAEITGFTLRTIMNWIENNSIKAKKIGGRWFIPKAEAERIVNEKGKSNYEKDEGNSSSVIS